MGCAGGTCGPIRADVVRDWRKLHKENIQNLCSSPNINGTIKLRMRWVGRVAYMGEDCIQNFDSRT
jgi:hypothetical protein